MTSDTTVARGLPSDWLNGWLAALGIAVLFPDVEVSWTDDAVPVARFRGVDDLSSAIYEALPSIKELGAIAIARDLPGRLPMPRNFSLDVWADRVDVERATGSAYLAASATDLVADADADPLPHAPFDPPMPQGITLADRVLRCRSAIEDGDQVRDSLAGMGRVVQQNGLGFDPRRLPTAVESAGKVYVDPVVEVLAFAALSLFPARASGTGGRIRPRGWTGPATRPGAFRWVAWGPWLNRWAVDAFLDQVHSGSRRHVIATFETLPYRPTGTADTTRAYASRRVS